MTMYNKWRQQCVTWCYLVFCCVLYYAFKIILETSSNIEKVLAAYVSSVQAQKDQSISFCRLPHEALFPLNLMSTTRLKDKHTRGVNDVNCGQTHPLLTHLVYPNRQNHKQLILELLFIYLSSCRNVFSCYLFPFFIWAFYFVRSVAETRDSL